MGVFILQTPEGSQRAFAAETTDGYRSSLLDQNSLHGWTIENDCTATVNDGVLRLESGNGWLRSDHLYTDFKLQLRWRALKEDGYDAGIYIRTLPGGKPFPRRGYQINLLQGREGDINRLPGAAASAPLRPAGQWNTFEITVRGKTVSLAVNGKPAYTASGLKIPAGYVGFQVEVPKGGRFEIRDVYLTELQHHSLFNGVDLAGWEAAGGNPQSCWSVEDGVLVGLKKKGPWLRTKEVFADFNLRLEYQLDPGANSGVYVRVPADGNHHRDDDTEPPAGFEVQILDDSAAKHRRLKPYQFCGSVYDIAGAVQHVGRPPGEWNTLEINCHGQNVTTGHNGVVIVSVTPREHPRITLRKLKGFLGLQNHGGGVRFRRLRVGPAIENFPVKAAAASEAEKKKIRDQRSER